VALVGDKALKKAIRKKVRETNNSLRAAYLQGLNDIVIDTPVDEGTARAGWNITINSPSGSLIGNTGTLFGMEAEIPKNVLSKKVYMTNNYSYINVLEYGGYKGVGDKTAMGDGGKIFSDQVAPSGWVRKSMQVMAKRIGDIQT